MLASHCQAKIVLPKVNPQVKAQRVHRESGDFEQYLSRMDMLYIGYYYIGTVRLPSGYRAVLFVLSFPPFITSHLKIPPTPRQLNPSFSPSNPSMSFFPLPSLPTCVCVVYVCVRQIHALRLLSFPPFLSSISQFACLDFALFCFAPSPLLLAGPFPSYCTSFVFYKYVGA